MSEIRKLILKGIDQNDIDMMSYDDRMTISKTVSTALGIDGVSDELLKSHKKPLGEGGKLHWEHALRPAEKAFYEAIDFQALLDGIMDRLTPVEKSTAAGKTPYKPDGQPFTPDELDTLDAFIAEFFDAIKGTERSLAIRAYLVGRMLETKERRAVKWDKLPKDYYELRDKFGLSDEEIIAIKWGELRLGEHIQHIGEKSRHKVQNIILEGSRKRVSIDKLRQRLFDEMVSEDGDLNRNWRSITISETNRLANEGRIGSVKRFDYVIGKSHHDACPWCMKNVNNKVLIKLDGPPPDYEDLDPNTQAYKDIAFLWENATWSGKDNFERSGSPNKKIWNDKTGKYRLEPRLHHELSMPGALCHTNGRCAWTRFVASMMYVGDDNKTHFKSDNIDEYNKFQSELAKRRNRVEQVVQTYQREAA